MYDVYWHTAFLKYVDVTGEIPRYLLSVSLRWELMIFIIRVWFETCIIQGSFCVYAESMRDDVTV